MGKHDIVNNQKGYSFVELIIYISLVGISMIVFTNFVIEITKSSTRSEAKLDIQYNARIALSKIVSEVRSADDININSGKLELNTTSANPSQFYLSDGVVFFNNEGNTYSITDENIQVTNLNFDISNNTLFIDIGVEKVGGNENLVQLSTSVVPRQLIYKND